MYGKLFTQMYDGTLGTKGPWQALVTFQQMVILADEEGVVDMTPEAIARRTTIPIEIIREGIVALEQPDPDSRSPALEGRRLERLSDDREWGWRVVNYLHYRSIRTADERRDYMRNYQRERRARVKASTGGKQSQPIAEVEVEVLKERAVRATRLPPDWKPDLILTAWFTEHRPDLRIGEVLERFRDYWAAAAGQKAVKRDWAAAFRTWARREDPPRAGAPKQAGEPPTIICSVCKQKVSIWTAGKCDPCWRASQGLEARP